MAGSCNEWSMNEEQDAGPNRQEAILEECFAAMDHLRSAYDLAEGDDVGCRLAAQIRGMAEILDAIDDGPVPCSATR